MCLVFCWGVDPQIISKFVLTVGWPLLFSMVPVDVVQHVVKCVLQCGDTPLKELKTFSRVFLFCFVLFLYFLPKRHSIFTGSLFLSSFFLICHIPETNLEIHPIVRVNLRSRDTGSHKNQTGFKAIHYI